MQGHYMERTIQEVLVQAVGGRPASSISLYSCLLYETFTSSPQPLSFCLNIAVDKCLKLNWFIFDVVLFFFFFFFPLLFFLRAFVCFWGVGWRGSEAGRDRVLVFCLQLSSSISCPILTYSICGSYMFPKRLQSLTFTLYCSTYTEDC